MSFHWQNAAAITGQSYKCGFCNREVGPSLGYVGNTDGVHPPGRIFICPVCSKPTFYDPSGSYFPSPLLGNNVEGITDAGVQQLFNEARSCSGARAYTACVLLCRKLLMNIAVQHGATAGESFVDYVSYLEANGFVPPNGRVWVDQVRQKGNEATHEIRLMNEKEAKQLITFVEMLLRFLYEFPTMVNP
jgi:hypothetical protein